MRRIRVTNGFKRAYQLMQKRGKDLSKIDAIISALASDAPLPESCRDHPLKGVYFGFRDCHVEPDWILIYKKAENLLVLEDTGTHADLFE